MNKESILKYCLPFLFLGLGQFSLSAQIGSGILRAAERKLEEKLADKLVEVMWGPIEESLDESLREKHRQDSLSGKTSQSYSDFVVAMSEEVTLRDSYSFDRQIEIKSTSKSGEKSRYSYYIDSEGKQVAFQKKNEANLYLLDLEQEVMASYNLTEKTVTGMPMLSQYFAGKIVEDKAKDHLPHTMEATGRSKKILGYVCREYDVESNITTGTIWVAEDMDPLYKESFQQIIDNYFSGMSKTYEAHPGFVMRSEYEYKEDGATTSSEVQKLNKRSYTLDNADYEKQAYR